MWFLLSAIFRWHDFSGTNRSVMLSMLVEKKSFRKSCKCNVCFARIRKVNGWIKENSRLWIIYWNLACKANVSVFFLFYSICSCINECLNWALSVHFAQCSPSFDFLSFLSLSFDWLHYLFGSKNHSLTSNTAFNMIAWMSLKWKMRLEHFLFLHSCRHATVFALLPNIFGDSLGVLLFLYVFQITSETVCEIHSQLLPDVFLFTFWNQFHIEQQQQQMEKES